MSRTSKAEARQAARTAVVKLLRQRLGEAGIFPYKGRGTSDVVTRLVADYNAGLVLSTPDQRAVVRRISAQSVWNWWKAFKEQGERGLSDRWGEGRDYRSFWDQHPRLMEFVVRAHSASPDASATLLRDQIQAAAENGGWPVPSTRTISRLLGKLREAAGSPTSVRSHHSRRPVFARFPLLGAAADALFALQPTSSLESVRDQLKPIAAKNGWPVPSKKVLADRRRQMSSAGVEDA